MMNVSGHLKRLSADLVAKATPRLLLDYRIKFRKRHFETEYWLVPLFCRKNSRSIDVGANVGQYSYYMGKYSTEVISFEPNTDLWPELRRLLGRRARLESAALSDHCGVAKFRYADDNTGLATIEPRNELRAISQPSRIKQRNVELRTLDSYEFSNVSFIKIDVEGHEEAVVRGAVGTLASSRPVLLIESENRHNYGAPQRLARMLADLRYDGLFLSHGELLRIDPDKDIDFNNDKPGPSYVNNFLFVPQGQQHLVEKIRERARIIGKFRMHAA